MENYKDTEPVKEQPTNIENINEVEDNINQIDATAAEVKPESIDEKIAGAKNIDELCDALGTIDGIQDGEEFIESSVLVEKLRTVQNGGLRTRFFTIFPKANGLSAKVNELLKTEPMPINEPQEGPKAESLYTAIKAPNQASDIDNPKMGEAGKLKPEDMPEWMRR